MSEDARETTVLASGTSMFPIIRDGMRVTLRAVPPDAVAPGDIVAFPQDGQTILHRIIEKRGDAWREKGDNRRVATWISAATFAGKATSCENELFIRSLDVPPDSRRLRAITFLSRVEANVLGRLARLARIVWPDLTSPTPRFLARLVSVITLPVRILIGPLLLSVYQTRAREEDDAQLERLVGLFRSLSGRAGEVARTDLAGLLFAHGLDSLAAAGQDGGRTVRYRAGFIFMNAVATMIDVKKALDSAGIEFVILKGPPLTRALYGDGSLRTSVDVDVLVAPGARDRAMDALAGGGFRVRGSALQQAAVKRGHFHIVFDPLAKNRVMVELHWALVDRANLYRIDEAAIRSRWTTSRVGDMNVGVLALEDEFLYLLLHIAKHGLFNPIGVKRGEPAAWFCRAVTGNRLIWFMDVQRFLEKYAGTLDWAALQERSSRWNISDEVFQTLEILNRLLPDAQAADALARLGAVAVGRRPTPSGAPLRGAATGAAYPAWVMRWMKADAGVTIRPARLLTLGGLFFPERHQLRNFYTGSRMPLILLYVWHPIRMTARLWRG